MGGSFLAGPALYLGGDGSGRGFGCSIFRPVREAFVNPWLTYIICYLIGSVTAGPVLARLYGVDLKTTGSGNIGATNVLRALGKKAAIVTFIGDTLKGSAAVLLGMHFLGDPVRVGLCGISAIIGHNFPVFLRFCGGKGVATSLGVLAAYLPLAAVGFVIIWSAVFRLWKISSLSALVAFFGVFLIAYFMYQEEFTVITVMFVLAVIMHRGNILRLVKGTEPRVGG